MTKIKRALTHKEINFPLKQIIGRYVPDTPGSQYYKNEANDLTFKLCERKEPTPLRPQYYLMQRLKGGAWVYLTSLYPREQGYFIIEIQRNYYKVNLATDKGGFTVLL